MALQSYSASLIITDNDFSIDKERLQKALNIDSLIKPKDIKIKSVKNSQNNEKYAIVTFSSMEEAIQFMMKLKEQNHYLQSLLLTPVSKQFFKYGIRTLSISIDSNDVNEDQLNDAFRKFGKIVFFGNGRGIVSFQNPIHAFRAMIELKNKLFNGVPINFQITRHFEQNKTLSSFIKKSKKKFIKPINQHQTTSTPVFVFDIPIDDSIDEEYMKLLFQEYQIIPGKFGVIFKTRYNCEGDLVRYAVISFSSREIALEAIADFNYKKISLDIIKKQWQIRLILADEETINILKTNKGKIMFKGSIIKSNILNSFADEMNIYGDVIDREINIISDKSQFHFYVQFRNVKDAEYVVKLFNGSILDSIPIEFSFCKEASENDKDKLYLYENLYEVSQSNAFFNFCLPQNDMLNSFQSICQLDKNDDFLIFVDDKQIKCSKKIISFLSPLIAKKLKNEKDISSYSISTKKFFDDFKNEKWLSFLLSQISQFPTQNELKNLIIKKIQFLLNSSIEAQLNDFISIAHSLAYFWLYYSDYERSYASLDFAILFKIYLIFKINHIIPYITNYFFYDIMEMIDHDQIIICEENLLIRFQIKYLLVHYDLIKICDAKILFKKEINFLIYDFFELSTDTLNQIDIEIIEMAIKDDCFKSINEDLFLFKILRLKNEYKQHLLKFVNFCYVSNEAMKYFLDTISFSEINGSLLGSLSDRLSMSLDYDYIDSNILIQKSSFNSVHSFLAKGFSNILQLFHNDSDFSFYINDEEIKSNLIIATLISPLIVKNLQADITCSSFTINFDSFLESFNKIYESLSYFLYLKKTKNEITKQLIQNKIIETIKQICQFTNLSHFYEFLASLDKLFADINCEENSGKKDEIILYFSVIINLFITFGNNNISENLINLFLFESNKIVKATINNKESLIDRIKYKEILSFNNTLNINYSFEIRFIVHNFEIVMSNVVSIDDIDEITWKIISMRLSLPVKQFDIPVYFNDKKIEDIPNNNNSNKPNIIDDDFDDFIDFNSDDFDLDD